MVGVKYIASVSFGKDSLAMLLRLLEEKKPLDAVVFYDTGMEFDAIYHIRDKVKILLEYQDIEYVELHPSEPFLYSMLERQIKYRSREGYHYGYGWCGGTCRWATKYKLVAINEFKKTLDDTVVDYVGIAADEPERFDKAKSDGKRLPLVEWGMTEADCLKYCHDKGFFWIEGSIELYELLDRVSCWCCRNKNLKELRNMYWHLPEYWERLRNLQDHIHDPLKKNSGSVYDLERRFQFEQEWALSGKKISTKAFYKALKA